MAPLPLPFLSLLCILTAPRAEDARIVMMGNSYTAQNALHELVADSLEATVPSFGEVYAKALTRGGSTLAYHAAQSDGSSGDTAWREALVSGAEAGSWDWVVLQDQSQVPGFPETNADWQASRDGAMVLDALIEAGGAETVFLLTWGRRDGDATNPARYPDFSTMQEHLTEGYLAYAEACGADGRPAWVIPAGHAFAAVHASVLAAGQDPLVGETAFTSLYAEDGSHPSPAGSWLASLTAAAALTGRSVSSVPTPTSVSAALAPTLLEAADTAVLDDPFGAIPFRWAHDWGSWEQPEGASAMVGQQGATFVISDTVTRPLVRLTEPTQALGYLALGADHGGVPGSGRLRVDGGTLELEGLLVGGGAEGELELLGGEIHTGALLLGSSGALARLRVESGSLGANRVEAASEQAEIVLFGGELLMGEGEAPAPVHHAGLLQTKAVSLTGDYSLPSGATLSLQPPSLDAAALVVHGAVELAGELAVELPEVPWEEGSSALLMEASDIDLAELVLSLPASSALELERGDPTRLWLRWQHDEPPLDSAEDSAGDSPGLRDSERGTPADPEGRCACSGAPSSAPAWLLLVCLLAGRRRLR
jgi:hypothetical protein